mgnify:FL=1
MNSFPSLAARTGVWLLVAAVVLPQTTAKSDDAAVAARMSRLEAETQALRAELEWMREQPVRLPAVEATPVSMSTELIAPAAAQDTEFYTLDELKGEMKKLAWTKGDFKIVPYGFLWADMIYGTDRTYPGAYTLWVPSRPTQGEEMFVIDARRTRLGLNIEGPRIAYFNNAKSGGQVEIDFMGVMDSIENKPSILLRHAYWEAKNDYMRIVVGQTWDLISPLYPGTLSYSVGWDGGNIGYRRTQFRLERYFHVSDTLLLTAATSLNQDIVPDLATVANVNRESAGWPVIMWRTAATIGPRGKGCRPLEVGVSGHIGETGLDFLVAGPPPLNLPPRDDMRFRTWSLNLDVKKQLTDRLGVQGELFTGENLSPFLGGIGQGVCIGSRNTIRAAGGWIDGWFDITPKLHMHAGYGIDDPNNVDFFYGRTYNHFIFWNLSYDITKQLVSGIEVTSWKTLYQDRRPAPLNTAPTLPGESVTIEWMVKYGF